MDQQLAAGPRSNLRRPDGVIKLYLRDDQAVAPEHFLGRDAVAGVTCAWSGEHHDATLRIVWLKRHGGNVWSFDEMFDSDTALVAIPHLRRELAQLPRTADCDQVVEALERLGFRNGRRPSLPDYF
jgi:hypothetical protein